MSVATFDGVFADRKVLLTGHTGFKGSWTALWLSRLGAHVVGYALDPPTHPALFTALDLGGLLVDVRGDVRDPVDLAAALALHAPEVVIHMAAQPLVLASYTSPHLTYETNVMGTVNLLEAVRECPSVRAVVVVTSDKCYQNQETGHAYRETDALGGRDPYSSSKGCAELVAAAYRESFFGAGSAVALATARAGNVIGGGDWAAERLVPDCARALSAGTPVAVRNPRAVRPWQHVLEPLAGYLWLAARLFEHGDRYGGAWNFGPDDAGEVTVAGVVERVVKAWGAGEWHAPATAARPHEAVLLKLDHGKAAAELGWRPVWSIDQAVDAATKWYRAYYEGAHDLAALTAGQMDDYVAAAVAGGIPWAAGGMRA